MLEVPAGLEKPKGGVPKNTALISFIVDDRFGALLKPVASFVLGRRLFGY
jgi:hypothetical protein